MIDGIKKFEELMRTDEAFQAKLRALLLRYPPASSLCVVNFFTYT